MTGSLLLQFNSIGNWKLPVRGVRVARRPHPDLAATTPLPLLAGCGALCGSSSEGSWGVSPSLPPGAGASAEQPGLAGALNPDI